MKSLRSRLTFTHTLVALVAVVIVAVLATVLIQRGFDRLAARQATIEAEDAADRLADFYQIRGSWNGVRVLLRRQIAQTGAGQRRRLQLFDAQNNLIFDSAAPNAPAGGARLRGGATHPITVNNRTVGTVVIGNQRADFNQAERDFITRVYVSMVLGSLLAAVVALGVGLLITGRVTRPLRSLKDAVQRLAAGTRHEPLAVPPDTELAELATAFNTMAAELEHQQHMRRQLVADIAHELRTPLSVLRLHLESVQDGIEQPTPAMFGSLSEEVGLLTRLVDDLRLLSLADAGQLSLTIAAVDAAAAVERAVTTAAARARQQGIDLRAEPCAAPLAAAADQLRLAQILGNLIENALRYTPPGGQVVVRVRSEFGVLDSEPSLSKVQSSKLKTQNSKPKTQSSVVFEVADSGPGIPPDELPLIFDRFYRADKARARETGGSGLGLAIVQRLAEMQGGRVWATSAPGQGATFHVALPAATSAAIAPARHSSPNVIQR